MDTLWADFVRWAGANREDIATISALAGVLGIGIAAITLLFTFKQLRDAKKALQSGNTYNIQREAREIIASLHSDNNFYSYIFENKDESDYDPKLISDARNKIGILFHFYLSVYRQANAHGITKTLVKSMGRDFKLFFSNSRVRSYYDMKKESGAYDKEYDKMVDYWCRKAG